MDRPTFNSFIYVHICILYVVFVVISFFIYLKIDLMFIYLCLSIYHHISLDLLFY